MLEPRNNFSELRALSNVIRGLAIDATEEAGHGHPGAAMGMADIATVLYCKYLRNYTSSPTWHDRDRVILSNGHASIFLYSLLYLTGVPGIELDDLKAFRKSGSITPGHPEFGHTPGVETTTGPLGQGVGMAVGFALAERRLREEFGPDICNHRTWVFAGDGCLMEGVGQEAASLAGHLKLGHLNLVYDCNNISIDGDTNLAFTENTAMKFEALGWHVEVANGHNFEEIDAALAKASKVTDKPSIVVFNTIIGFGAPSKAGTAGVHGAKLGEIEARAAKQALELPEQPFEIPEALLSQWRSFGRRSFSEQQAWERHLKTLPLETKKEYLRRLAGDLPDALNDAIGAFKNDCLKEPQKIATRKSSQLALEVLSAKLPEMVGGSADLTGSNLTQTKATSEHYSPRGSGRYLHFGVREFAMGAATNGMALHGGVRPYCGTFLVFSDYMRNAIRLAALMKTQSIFVMTHDSIGLGEDGPTHQPVEHLASLRAIPGLNVFRPADSIETLEAYEAALTLKAPSLIALSRQPVEQVRLENSLENLSLKGGYILREPASGKRDITIIATGSEVSLAMETAETLEEKDVKVAVVSLPCWNLFEAQSDEYRNAVLGSAPRIAVEAASPFGWTKYVSDESRFIGVGTFGQSASAEQLYEQFGLTAENIVSKSTEVMGITNF